MAGSIYQLEHAEKVDGVTGWPTPNHNTTGPGNQGEKGGEPTNDGSKNQIQLRVRGNVDNSEPGNAMPEMQPDIERNGDLSGFWSNSIAIPCADGKWRRVPGRVDNAEKTGETDNESEIIASQGKCG